MPPTTRRARALSAISHVFALPKMWAIVAEHSGVVGAWRLTGVCVAARVGAKEWLRTLPGLVMCGGVNEGEAMSGVWRLDLGELQWTRMSNLTSGRYALACCTVRGGVVVLGGFATLSADAEDDDESQSAEAEITVANVELFGFDAKVLPPLSCGPICDSTAVGTAATVVRPNLRFHRGRDRRERERAGASAPHRRMDR